MEPIIEIYTMESLKARLRKLYKDREVNDEMITIAEEETADKDELEDIQSKIASFEPISKLHGNKRKLSKYEELKQEEANLLHSIKTHEEYIESLYTNAERIEREIEKLEKIKDVMDSSAIVRKATLPSSTSRDKLHKSMPSLSRLSAHGPFRDKFNKLMSGFVGEHQTKSMGGKHKTKKNRKKR